MGIIAIGLAILLGFFILILIGKLIAHLVYIVIIVVMIGILCFAISKMRSDPHV